MRYLFDNDIVLKFGQFDLLMELCALLGATPSNTRHLSTLPFVVRDRLKRKTGRGQRGLKRILDWCEQYPDIGDPSRADILERASRSPSIDPGEAILLAEAFGDPEIILITGDKRCVRALGREPDLAIIVEGLRGRIQILESIVLRLIQHFGFEVVRKKVVAMQGIDQMLEIAFGTEEHSIEVHALEALRSAETEVERICPGLVVQAS